MCVLLQEPFSAFKFANWVLLVNEIYTRVHQQMTYWLANLGNVKFTELLEIEYKCKSASTYTSYIPVAKNWLFR